MEDRLFIDGINCNPDTALKEMNFIKKKFHKEDGIKAFHSFQSFKEGEVTPKLAHSIGIELANEMWGDRFQVIVATHLDKKHIHNHFVINSVSFLDGKRYYDNHSNYAELRRLNDLICKEHNLSVLEEKKTKAGINYTNFQKKNINYISTYKRTKLDIDDAIEKSSNFNEFKEILTNIGYEFNIRYNKISIRPSTSKRNIRIERIFGDDYSIENINKRIRNEYLVEKKTYNKKNKNILEELLKKDYKSLYGLYIHYLKILKIIPNNKYKNIYRLRDDVYKMDEISKEVNFLVSNNIETEEQFINFLEKKEKKLLILKDKREKLQRNYKKYHNENEYKELENINKEIPKVRDDIKELHNIRNRKEQMKENLLDLKEDKEVIRDEYFK